MDGGDHRLHRIPQKRLFPASSGQHFAPAKLQHLAQADLARHVGTGFLPDQRVEPGGELPLACCRIRRQQRLGHNEAQHPVAQEFQPLIVGPGDRPDRRMRHRAQQQVGLAEAVPQPALKGQKVRRQSHGRPLIRWP